MLPAKMGASEGSIMESAMTTAKMPTTILVPVDIFRPPSSFSFFELSAIPAIPPTSERSLRPRASLSNVNDASAREANTNAHST